MTRCHKWLLIEDFLNHKLCGVIATVPSPVLTPKMLQAGVCMQAHVAPAVYAAWGGSVAGDILEWFRTQFARDPHERDGSVPWSRLLDECAAATPGSNGVTFRLHPVGGPPDNPHAMGTFTGQRASTTRADMLHAVIESLNILFLDKVNALETQSRLPIHAHHRHRRRRT